MSVSRRRLVASSFGLAAPALLMTGCSEPFPSGRTNAASASLGGSIPILQYGEATARKQAILLASPTCTDTHEFFWRVLAKVKSGWAGDRLHLTIFPYIRNDIDADSLAHAFCEAAPDAVCEALFSGRRKASEVAQAGSACASAAGSRARLSLIRLVANARWAIHETPTLIIADAKAAGAGDGLLSTRALTSYVEG